MKLGINSYSLYQAMAAGNFSIQDVMEWAADVGAQHIEIVPMFGFDFNSNPELVDQLREKAAEVGIDISNYAIGANFITDTEEAYELEIQRVISEVDRVHQLGAKLMRHDVAFRSDTSIAQFNEDLKVITRACQRIADHAEQYEITTSVENHGYYVQASDRIQTLIHAVGRSNFKTTLDVGNFVCVDENPISAVQKNIKYASFIHIKDFYVRPPHRNPGEGWFKSEGGNFLRGAIVGQGDLDLYEILRIVKHSGYDGYMSIEYEGMEECRNGTRISFNNVKRIWNEV
jgi:sugar phosphate isomerase/epimerase